MKNKIIRTSTIALSLDVLLKGQLKFLNKHYNVEAISGGGDHLNKVALREGVTVMPISMQRAISPLKDLVSLWRLYQYFRKEKLSIIHSITPKAGLLTMIAGYLAGVPLRMHTFTGLIFPYKKGILQFVLIQMDRLMCACATHIYPEGIGVQNDLIKYKITNKRLKVLANGNVNGIDTSYFHPDKIDCMEKSRLKSKLRIDKGDIVFVFVGRLVGDKGINELVEAFVKVQTNFENVKLLLVGPKESELDPLLEITLAELRCNKNIIEVGYVEDVRPYFSISNCLVFPSYREGFPNVVLQAGAMNLPCIVTDINGCNEIISPNKNGVIIPVKDVVSLGQAMERMVSNKEEREQLAKNSRQLIEANYKQEYVWNCILAEYKTALEKHGIN